MYSDEIKKFRIKKDAVILAIESSCDETAAAIVKNGREILSSEISSSCTEHISFGVNKEDVIVQIINSGDNYYHSHNFYELFYITGGSIKHSLNNITHELSIGDVVFLRPGDIHCFLREKGNSCSHRDIALTVPLYEKIAAFYLKERWQNKTEK